ncbi:M28 family metallopeptidase [Haloarchaeobius amylolyticus]|uniref:M28 family metallopeptidase n=1 Tax=Haloarchaeobius amylolyticus TaxID=1198296 RepID=UPI002270219C|nr:M28 family metallopeptidase [Haloarchaeobius amylolyticus]
MTQLDATLGRLWRDDTPWEFLTALCELEDRLAGHPGEARAADLVADAFETAGVNDLAHETAPITRWSRGDTRLRVVDPVTRGFEAVALPYSPAGEAEARLVDVGHGTPDEIAEADLDGAVALASTDTPGDQRFVHRMEKYGHALDAGAEAFVFANHKPGQLPPTGSLRFDEAGAIPGVGVSYETGEWLREYAERDGTVSLSVDATTQPGETHVVHGTVGPDTDEELLVLAHFDAHDVGEGALDNGCGIAVVVALARALADVDLDRRVRVAGVGGEEVGLLGSEALAADLDTDRIEAVVNVDGAGRHRDLVAYTHAHEELADVAADLAAEADHPVHVRPDPHPWSDHWPFLRAGVPSLQLHSDSGERGRGVTHTRADTRDKADSRTLREHAMLTCLLVRSLACRNFSRLGTDTLLESLREQSFEPGMRAAGIWPQ